jgi:HAD superfamily hydrolase (TIGR01509 family)
MLEDSLPPKGLASLRFVLGGYNRVVANGRSGFLFDVDGTLVDSNYLHTVAWSRALRDGREWAPMNAIHRLVGMGGDQLVPKLLGHDSPTASEARPRRFRELIDEVRAFPGATDLLRTLHGLGAVVVLATSSPADELNVSLRVLDAEDAIDAHTTRDDVARSKPAPDLFRAALRVAGIDPDRALAVGDSVWDIEAAGAAGVGCIGVESGGFSHHELSEAGAVHVYRDVQEMLDHLSGGPLSRLVDKANIPAGARATGGDDADQKKYQARVDEASSDPPERDTLPDTGRPTGEARARMNRANEPPA